MMRNKTKAMADGTSNHKCMPRTLTTQCAGWLVVVVVVVVAVAAAAVALAMVVVAVVVATEAAVVNRFDVV